MREADAVGTVALCLPAGACSARGARVRLLYAAGCPDAAGYGYRVLPPIRTVTVGFGVSPNQPLLRVLANARSRVADCNRRLGISPTPEHVYSLLSCYALGRVCACCW